MIQRMLCTVCIRMEGLGTLRQLRPAKEFAPADSLLIALLLSAAKKRRREVSVSRVGKEGYNAPALVSRPL